MQAIFTHFAEELPVALHASEGADAEHTGTVDREQSSDRVEFAGKDLENDQSE